MLELLCKRDEPVVVVCNVWPGERCFRDARADYVIEMLPFGGELREVEPGLRIRLRSKSLSRDADYREGLSLARRSEAAWNVFSVLQNVKRR